MKNLAVPFLCFAIFGCSEPLPAEDHEASASRACFGPAIAADLGMTAATTFNGVLYSDSPSACRAVPQGAGDAWCTGLTIQAGVAALTFVNNGDECGCECPDVEIPDPFAPRQCAAELEAEYQVAAETLGPSYQYLDSGVIAWGPHGCGGGQRIGPCEYIETVIPIDLEYVEWQQDGDSYCGCACVGCIEQTKPKVDVLFVVDNSGSMGDEQMMLSRTADTVLRGITTGDVDDDGVVDFEPIEDVHAGVITTDIGAGALASPYCTAPNHDGILQPSGTAVDVSELGDLCATTSCDCDTTLAPPYVDIDTPSTADLNAARVDFACTARQGVGGCSYEQPLEAMLKSVTPVGGLFPDGSPFFAFGNGHQDGANAGFLRDDAYLLVVIITDDDDCSAESALYEAVPFLGYPAWACYQDWAGNTLAEYFKPIARYADALLELRSSQRIGVLAITGVPQAVDGSDFDGLLAHPDMQQTDTAGIACSSAIGSAEPARRIVGVAQAVADAGAYADVTSICDADHTDAIRRALSVIDSSLFCEGCDEGLTECSGGICVDLDSDESHCGSCDSACPAGGVCIDGQCATHD